jgi:preprotein translocase subunit SecF
MTNPSVIAQFANGPTGLFAFRVNRHRRQLWLLSSVAIALSLLGMAISWLSPSIRAPLRPGLDFTGGTQIQIERRCEPACGELKLSALEGTLRALILPSAPGEPAPALASTSVQLLDGGRSVVMRLPSLSPDQAELVLNTIEPLVGETVPGALSVDTIGPTLGSQLLQASLLSLLVSFVGISLYITFRYDRIFALLALLCLAHDVLITCGLFAWLGLVFGVEVNSLFAVALLTIAGYSVNDTVVIFDRIREKRNELKELPLADQADEAVISTLTRSVYTSLTTLLPLVALIFFGGSTLFWFAIALSFGILIGAWSSIAVAPTLLPVLARR